MSKTYTLTEVQRHNKRDDCWVIIHNKVYDATKYLEDHPGGIEILVGVAGTDATQEFEDTGHSQEATDSLEGLYLGDLPEEEHAAKLEVYRPTFVDVGHETAVAPIVKKVSNSSSGMAGAIVKLGLLGGVGVAAWYARTHDIGVVRKLLSELPLSKLPSITSTSGSTTSRLFWMGFGIATIAEVSATLGLSVWGWSKFDVQGEFTHFTPRRPARRERAKAIAKANPLSSGPSPSSRSNVLEPKEWRHFKLVRKTLVSPNVYRFMFALPHMDDVLGLPTGQHIALRATINGKAVSRSYTPISNNSDLGRIELLVKVYDAGQMTKHLEGMKVGETIEIRGPKGAMEYSTEYAKHIGMIAGGTGITPMYQLIRAICADDSDKTKISLIYANNTEEDILLRDELDNFVDQCPDKFNVHYVLAKPPAGWTGSSGFVSQDLIKEHLPAAVADTKMLLCGPPPMINAMKKSLVGLGFQEPGVLSRVTDQVFLF